MSHNIIQEKSFNFALKAVEIYKYLIYEKREYVLSKQFLRSATSVGANIEESIGGQSERDFLHKVSISYKEARETVYWLKLLAAGDFLESGEAKSLIEEADELCRILGKIISTLKSKRTIED